jgi:hypothetical protein
MLPDPQAKKLGSEQPPELNPLQKESMHLESLSVEQIERALVWLSNPKKYRQPKELKSLSPTQWFLLDQLLMGLQWERDNNPIH